MRKWFLTFLVLSSTTVADHVKPSSNHSQETLREAIAPTCHCYCEGLSFVAYKRLDRVRMCSEKFEVPENLSWREAKRYKYSKGCKRSRYKLQKRGRELCRNEYEGELCEGYQLYYRDNEWITIPREARYSKCR